MSTIEKPFHAANTKFAYQLHYHIGFRTRRCVSAFNDTGRASFLRESLNAICERGNHHLLEHDISTYWVRLLISLRPNHAPSKVVQTIKANTSRFLFDRFPEVVTETGGQRSLWSRGYYFRGVGSVTNQVVARYVAEQMHNHEFVRGDSRLLATFQHPNPARFFDLRPFSHCVAEYNCHLVFCPLRHAPVIEAELGNELMKCILDVSARNKFEPISLAVLQDHVHLFASLRPDQAPEDLALTIMNETAAWIEVRNPGAIHLWNSPAFWTPSAFLRTAGAVTTDTVRAYLKSQRADWYD